jgi:hypothetical protein
MRYLILASLAALTVVVAVNRALLDQPQGEGSWT